ncbi:MAG: phosphoserine phosphatase SerB [Parvularculaceae bacterium]|nr:phosphoserine phosphatase SerB [Parvularculaceae bacterium]
MFHTAVTLVCNPAAPALNDDIADDVGGVLLEFAGEVKRRPLADGVADDFLIGDAIDSAGAVAAIRDVLSEAPVDIIVQPAARRKKRLIIADMDSTIIEQECIDELADFAGLKAEISAITERAMRGELDFEQALDERVGKLKGLPQSVLDEAFRTRITLTPGARTLVQTMRGAGAVAVLVSGGFTFFASRVAALAGFDHYRANELLIDNGALSGAVARPIIGRAAKEQSLVEFAAKQSIDIADTLAVGDGANDLAMIERAGLGVAFRAKPKVAQAADASITHGDLTALLYLQGYADADFAA